MTDARKDLGDVKYGVSSKSRFVFMDRLRKHRTLTSMLKQRSALVDDSIIFINVTMITVVL